MNNSIYTFVFFLGLLLYAPLSLNFFSDIYAKNLLPTVFRLAF